LVDQAITPLTKGALMLTTPAQQVEGLRQEIRDLDLEIEQCKAELVEQQFGLDEDGLHDPVIIALYDGRKQRQGELDQLLKNHPELA
jgi:hypothetical protein